MKFSPRYVICTRVSTTAQSGDSLDTQLNLCKQYVAAYPGKVIANFNCIQSAFHAPFAELITHMETHRRVTYVFAAADRFSRFKEDAKGFLVLMKTYSHSMVFCRERFHLSPANRTEMEPLLMAYIGNGELEARQMSARAKERLAVAKSRFEWVTRPPFGYTKVGKKLHKVPSQQRIISVINVLKRHASGIGIQMAAKMLGFSLPNCVLINTGTDGDIAALLNRFGVAHPNGKWTPDRVSAALRNIDDRYLKQSIEQSFASFGM